jgi:hypothetical protein
MFGLNWLIIVTLGKITSPSSVTEVTHPPPAVFRIFTPYEKNPCF